MVVYILILNGELHKKHMAKVKNKKKQKSCSYYRYNKVQITVKCQMVTCEWSKMKETGGIAD